MTSFEAGVPRRWGLNYKWLAFIAVGLGAFMGTLDSGIVYLILPALSQVFGAEPSFVVWVVLAYMLTFTGLMLTLGRLADMFGRKRIFVLGFVIFTVGLALGSLTQSMEQLIGARIVQAVGGAMVVANEYALVTAAFPSFERGRALGLLEAVVGSGLMTGPAIGGFLLDLLDWRALFYLRLPVGVIGCFLSWVLLRDDRSEGAGGRFDGAGALTLFGGLVLVLFAINQGQPRGWTSPVVAGSVVAGGLLFLAFLALERQARSPVVDLGLFRSRVLSAMSATLFLNFIAQAAAALLLPFLLLQGIQMSSSVSGLMLTIIPLMMLLFSPVTGWLSDRLGSWMLSWGGLALAGLGLLVQSRLGADATALDVAWRLFVQGIGAALFLSPTYSAVMGAAPRDRLGTASALIPTVRTLGMGTGLALGGAIFATRRAYYAESLVGEELARHALVGGIQDSFVVVAAICALGVLTSFILGRAGDATKKA